MEPVIWERDAPSHLRDAEIGERVTAVREIEILMPDGMLGRGYLASGALTLQDADSIDDWVRDTYPVLRATRKPWWRRLFRR